MDIVIESEKIKCAICDTEENSQVIFSANFKPRDFNPEIFSARRLPDRIHYRIVRCKKCGLLRSDPRISSDVIANLYAKSDQTYDEEVENITTSYLNYLHHLDKSIPNKNNLLEIGCGSGFFLEQAKKNGYSNVYGIEPSSLAVNKAHEGIKQNITIDVFHKDIYKENFFDVICLFQVFDHLPFPNETLDECYKILKPGGAILCLNHNASSFSAKLLNEKSPIIDIEHTYLYDLSTMPKLFEKHGFNLIETGPSWNLYSLGYLVQLLPFPTKIKKSLIQRLRMTKFGNLRFRVFLGNMFLIAQKPTNP